MKEDDQLQESEMSGIKYRVSLTEEEKLESLLRKGKSAARKQTRARILLKPWQYLPQWS
jgi:hypothetical protein